MVGRASTAIAVSALFAVSCASAPKPCVTTGACGEGNLCIAGACSPKNTVPADPANHKIELDPESIAVVTSRGPEPWTGADIPLGRQSLGSVVLLVRFAKPFQETSKITSAYLVLEPLEGVRPSGSPVAFQVARIQSKWDPQDVSWARLPSLAQESQGVASNWGGRPLYVDVTKLVNRWKEQRDDDEGLAIVATASDPAGTSYAFGTAGGRAPRLIVYLR